MTTNKLFLLLGTSLSLVPQTLNAQCVSPIQDCYALGYTQSSCPNGKGVKCPFGSGWYCGGTAAQDCIKLGYDKDCTGAGESGVGETCNGKYQSCTCDSSYQYTCTGTGYSGGSGSACGGKYTSCSCATGYEWKDSACIETIPTVSCAIGTLYYSDGTCYNQKINSKTLLGVVIMEKTSSASGWIMTVNPIRTNIQWSTANNNPDIPELTNYSSIPNDVQSSCSNTDIITSYGNKEQYPAAWAAKEYRPIGTPNNKYWCLPSGGLLNNLNNSTNFTKVNLGIVKAEGVKLGYANQPSDEYIDEYEDIWSSSEFPKYYAWHLVADINGTFTMGSSNGNGYSNDSVRPVLSF